MRFRLQRGRCDVGRRRRLVGLGLIGVLLLAGAPSAGQPDDEPPPAPRPVPRLLRRVPAPDPLEKLPRSARAGEVLVKFDRQATASEESVLAAAGARVSERVAGTRWVLARIGSQRPGDVAQRLRQHPAVAEATPNYFRAAFAANPNDPLYRYGYNQRPYLDLIRVPQSWDLSVGSVDQTIAVVDTGVQLGHPDLAAKLVSGWDFVDDDSKPRDANGHGTWVAGLAAAATWNARGIAGVNWRARVMPVRVLDEQGIGTDSDIAAGIVWAANHGADVINASLGGPRRSRVLRDAVAYALAKDVVVVAAVGNAGSSTVQYPAGYPGVVGVSATSQSGDFAYYSSYGTTVDLAAPGHDIASTYWISGRGESYATASGSSGAAALVSGAAGLLRAASPRLNQAQITQRLRATARDAGPRGVDPYYGAGLLDVYAALTNTRAAPLRAAAGDAHEPNGHPDQARPLDDPYYESATIAPQGDVDWYYLDVASAGVVRFYVESSYATPYPEQMYPNLQGFGPDLKPLTKVVPGQSTGEYLYVPVASPGRYYLRVRNRFGSRSQLSPGTPWGYVIKHEMHSWSEAVPDLPPPWIRNVSPPDFAEGVATSVQPTVRFGRTMEAATITKDTVRVVDADLGRGIAATVAYNTATRTATITPSTALVTGRPYRVMVTGVRDAAGRRLSFARSYFTVGTTPDTTPPQTTVTLGLGGAYHQDTFFWFVSSEAGSRFQCRFDRGSWNSCDSPLKYAMVPEGTHTLEVRATDAAGNVDPTPAARTWTMPPPNDNFAAATTLTESSGTLTGASVMATTEPGEPRHAGQGGRSVWYRWTAPASGTATFNTFGSEFRTVLAIYTGSSVSSLTPVASNVNWRGTGWSRVAVKVNAGTTYRIAVDGAQSTFPERGTIWLRWRLH